MSIHQDPLVFPSHSELHVSLYLPKQSLHSFTHVDTQNLVQRMLFLCQCCFYVNQSRIVHDVVQRLQELDANP
jgi:hypothetical protein